MQRLPEATRAVRGAVVVSGVNLNVPADVLDALADAVAARVVERLREHVAGVDDGWMTTKQAAEYLGVSVNTLHKLTAAQSIPFEQTGERGRCYFKRRELDEWRASGAL